MPRYISDQEMLAQAQRVPEWARSGRNMADPAQARRAVYDYMNFVDANRTMDNAGQFQEWDSFMNGAARNEYDNWRASFSGQNQAPGWSGGEGTGTFTGFDAQGRPQFSGVEYDPATGGFRQARPPGQQPPPENPPPAQQQYMPYMSAAERQRRIDEDRARVSNGGVDPAPAPVTPPPAPAPTTPPAPTSVAAPPPGSPGGTSPSTVGTPPPAGAVSSRYRRRVNRIRPPGQSTTPVAPTTQSPSGLNM